MLKKITSTKFRKIDYDEIIKTNIVDKITNSSKLIILYNFVFYLSLCLITVFSFIYIVKLAIEL